MAQTKLHFMHSYSNTDTQGYMHKYELRQMGRHTAQLHHMLNKLDIMSELYSCGNAIQRGFHLHTGPYPSNTFQKEQFVCCGGPFVTGNETMQTLILIWNNTAVVERRPGELCSSIKDIHLLKSDKALKK